MTIEEGKANIALQIANNNVNSLIGDLAAAFCKAEAQAADIAKLSAEVAALKAKYEPPATPAPETAKPA